MGLVQRAIGAGSLQARALITRQLSHLPTPKQSRGSREARGQRIQAARAPRRSRSSLWLAWPVQRPQSWAQQSLARPRGREWSGDARCSQVRSQQPRHRDPRGNRCSALQDLRPGLPACRRTALEPARAGDRSGAPWESWCPKGPRHVSQVSFLGCRPWSPTWPLSGLAAAGEGRGCPAPDSPPSLLPLVAQGGETGAPGRLVLRSRLATVATGVRARIVVELRAPGVYTSRAGPAQGAEGAQLQAVAPRRAQG